MEVIGKPLTLEKALVSSRLKALRDWRDGLKYRYAGFTIKAFEDLYRLQEGKCAICQAFMIKPDIDHDHLTELVRGLLCRGCNIKLTAVEDVGWLERALSYLGH